VGIGPHLLRAALQVIGQVITDSSITDGQAVGSVTDGTAAIYYADS